MVVLIAGASHTGKTALAQNLLEKYNYPYLSIDHLKMGLIRSKNTDLTPEDDDKLTDYLWNIVKEIVKTAIENNQNLIVEGVYIPFDWKKDFDIEYLESIKYFCLIMSRNYIEKHFNDIKKYADIIEKRLDDFLDKNEFIKENEYNLKMCNENNLKYILIDENYNTNIEL